MKQIQCMECGESITNPLCPECIVEQAIACLADKQMSGKIEEAEVKRLNKKLATILKANYSEWGVGCISCKSTFAICPHCTARYLKNEPIFQVPKNAEHLWYLRDILPGNQIRYLFYLFLKNYYFFEIHEIS